MKNIILIMSHLLIGLVLISGNALAGKTPSLAFLQKVSNELNKGLPQKIDNEVLLKSTFAQIGALGYLYILVNYNASEVDTKYFISKQTPPIKNFACTNPRMKRFFEDNVDVIYSYYGKDMKYVGEIIVTSKDCKNM